MQLREKKLTSREKHTLTKNKSKGVLKKYQLNKQQFLKITKSQKNDVDEQISTFQLVRTERKIPNQQHKIRIISSTNNLITEQFQDKKLQVKQSCENLLKNLLIWIKRHMLQKISRATNQDVLTTQIGQNFYHVLRRLKRDKLNKSLAEIFINNFRICMEQNFTIQQVILFFTKFSEQWSEEKSSTKQQFIKFFKNYGLSEKQKENIIRNQSLSEQERQNNTKELINKYEIKINELTVQSEILFKKFQMLMSYPQLSHRKVEANGK